MVGRSIKLQTCIPSIELSAPALIDLMYGFWVSRRIHLSLSAINWASTCRTLEIVYVYHNGEERRTHIMNFLAANIRFELKLDDMNNFSHCGDSDTIFKAKNWVI